jgi:CubicO group peptidase (beta-lactamase class C family)
MNVAFNKKTVLAVIAIPPFLIGLFVVGLFVYMNATMRPLHSDPNGVPSVTYSPSVPKWADAIAQGRQLARAGLLEQNLPGLSVAVGAGGELVWAEGFGYADLEKKTPVRPETRFRVGDASKAVTSAAVGLLLENNKLHLDDEIQMHVPEFPKKPWPVTLRHLMAQVAGVPTDQGDEAPLANAAGDDGNPSARCDRVVDGFQMDNFAKRELRFEPGTKYYPSSYGWVLVSAAVEAAGGEPFFSFMRRRVFEPLGLRDTTIDIATEPIPDRATFYFPKFAGDPRYGPQDVRQGDHSCYFGAGAFLSTPSDLVKFGMAFNSGKLVKPDTVKLLQTEQQLASGEATGYGLGWKVETLPLAGEPTRMAGHASKEDFIGGSTYLMTFPDRGLVVAVMTNTSFADANAMALKVAEAFARK